MRYYIFTLLLGFSFHCAANDQEPFGEAGEGAGNVSYSPVQPKRGYPAIVPFVKTELSIVSIHSPTLENQPTPLLEMPLVSEIHANWPHTDAGDEIYNITKWFPLHEMRAPDEKHADEPRWVYYNQTSGYVIANADHFLQASVYDFIDGSITQNGLRVRLNMIYLETSEMVALNLESIQKASHDVIFRTSSVSRMYEKFNQHLGNVSLDTEVMEANGRKAFYVMIDYFIDGYGTVMNGDLTFPVSEWLIYECGISEAGKRKLMLIRADYINQYEQVVHLQSSRAEFIKSEFPLSEQNPFSDHALEYYRLHPVPPDIVNLLSDSEHGSDANPFSVTDNADLKDEEITELVRNQGVKAKAYKIADSGYVLAYADENAHGQLEELFACLDGDRPLALKCDFNFYEIDAPIHPEKADWNVIDLLEANPRKLASLGLMALSGSRTTQYSGESECSFELIRNEVGVVDIHLDFKIDLPLLKCEEKYEGSMKVGVPTVISLGMNPKTNRMIMMLVRCQEIDEDSNTLRE